MPKSLGSLLNKSHHVYKTKYYANIKDIDVWENMEAYTLEH